MGRIYLIAKLDLATLISARYVLFIRHDPVTNDVLVLTKTALHRISKGKVTERWYLSEQFNPDGQVTLLASLKPKKSNPWAIMARHTKLMDTKPIWKQLQEAPNMAKRVAYEYDDLGDHFRIDGKLLQREANHGFVFDTSRYTMQEMIDLLKLQKK